MSEKPKKTSTSWKPGQSGNPKGRPKDQEYREAIAMLKAKSPELMKKAIGMVLCEKPSEKVACAILSKICPDKLDLSGDTENPLLVVINRVGGKSERQKGKGAG